MPQEPFHWQFGLYFAYEIPVKAKLNGPGPGLDRSFNAKFLSPKPKKGETEACSLKRYWFEGGAFSLGFSV